MAISIKKKGGENQALPTTDLGVRSGEQARARAPAVERDDAGAPTFRPPGAPGPTARSPAPAPTPTQVDTSIGIDSAEADATEVDLPDPPEPAAPVPEDPGTLIDNSLSTTVVENDGQVPAAIYKTGRSGRAGIQPGEVIDDRYRLQSSLGSGGMAQVWLAEHIAIEKKVAIKVLAPKGSSADPRGQLAERFLREAKATAAIKHSGVVDITDFGRLPSGLPYFVMEHLEGGTLHQAIVEHGPMHWLDARDALVELADALIAAHAQGIVHCDLKPSNIFLMGEPGQHSLKIIDFGIAKLTQLSATAKNITTPGMITGTPTYMSPEQTRGRALDARTDIYALGCIAYFLMHGRPPFEAEENSQLLKMQLFSRPTPLKDLVPEIPDALCEVIAKALEKDPDSRFQTMEAMRDALAASGDDFDLDAKPYVREDAKTLIRKLDAPLKVSTSNHPLASGRPLRPPAASDAVTIAPGAMSGAIERNANEASQSRASASHADASSASQSTGATASSSTSEPSPTERSGVTSPQPVPARSLRSPAPVQPQSSPLVPVLIGLLVLALGAIAWLVATR